MDSYSHFIIIIIMIVADTDDDIITYNERKYLQQKCERLSTV